MSQQHALSLDGDLETFRNDLTQASEVVVRLYERLDQNRITPARTRAQIASLFDEPLPEKHQPMESILNEVESKIFANSTFYLSPRFFGYINSGGNQASILAELLASAVNQILALWHFSPAASEVERRVIRWIAEFIGYPSQAGGCLLSGGSAGNLVGLAVARKQKAPFDADSLGMRGGPLLTVYASQEVHASVDKAMVILGMGRDQLRKIAVRDHEYGSRRPVRSLGGILPCSRAVVPRGCGVRRTCRKYQSGRRTLPGIGAGRFHRGQPAQVVVRSSRGCLRFGSRSCSPSACLSGCGGLFERRK